MPGEMPHLFLKGGNLFKAHSQKIGDGLVSHKEKWLMIMKGKVTRYWMENKMCAVIMFL